MLITAVEPRRKSLCALYIDGEFAMKLDAQTLLENRFDVGREIDDEDLHEVIRLSNERRAREKALRLISYRDHSKKELTEKIMRTCDHEAAEKAAERMEELGLINDESFARRYAESLIFGKNKSKTAARLELAQKGIDRELADEILDGIEVDPRGQIKLLIEKKYKNIDDEKIRRRAVAALQRNGFRWDDIRAVLEEYRMTIYE
ncbi:MAG: regulatory protein RecX [Ruminococcus sp.]|nr:regulatory protein RecX [Ruminococcus sp.]MEE0857310.1 regulatory protein RecX [Ruminococcus sp.]